MRLLRGLLVCTVAVGWMACSDDTSPPKADTGPGVDQGQTDRCTPEGKQRCNGTTIQSCKKGTSGVLDWADDSDCGATNLSCLDNGTKVQCSAGCSDSCQTEDVSRCRGTEIEKCTKGSDGCKAWVVGTNCATTSQVCDESGTAPVCADKCTDGCTTAGDSRCQGSKVETCATGANGCLAWTTGYDCATNGWACGETGGAAKCEFTCSSAPTTIANPTPANAATDVSAATAKLDWDDVASASGYDVYLGDTSVTGACPPPAYPDTAYQRTTASEWPVTLADNKSYCWKVVARNATGGCIAEGAAYTFSTGCTDAVAGAPTVTSGTTVSLSSGATAGSLTLTFSEDVQNVSSSLTWTAVTGTGTLGAVTQVDAKTYTVAFSGLASGDSYTLAVGTGVTDSCGTALAAAVTINISVLNPGATAGTTCADALDITGASGAIALTGDFTDDPTVGGTCDTTPTNAVWYKFTAAVSGVHSFLVENATTTAAYTRLAVFETDACSPYGTEVTCQSPSSKTASAGASLTAGTTYLILAHTDGGTYTMIDPKITVTPPSQALGASCDKPIDLSNKTFPYQAKGEFTTAPAAGSSCDSTLFNAAWFSYKPAADGWYRVSAINSALGTSNMDIAVFEGTACNPYGTEVTCAGTASFSVAALAYLKASTTYTLLVAPSNVGEQHKDPLILIEPLTPAAGQTCDQAINVSSATFPYTATGSFTWNPHVQGSCDSSIYNGTWFSYTPTATGWYDVSGKLTQSTLDDADLVIFEGSGCYPTGAERACLSSTTDTAATQTYFVSGTTYTILLASDSSSDVNTDPTLDIGGPLTPAAGQTCDQAIDLSSVTFPYTATGTFTWNPHVTGGCDSSIYNGAWFKYTPATTGWYDITGQLTQSTLDDARLVVFDGSGCFPTGTELGCSAGTTDTGAALVQLTAGTTYTILLAANLANDVNTDPIINIQPGSAPPEGLSCSLTAKTTSANHTVDGSGHDCWAWTADASDTSNDHTFSCDSIVGGDVVVEYTTGASQTTLNFDAVIANYDTNAYLRVEVSAGTCTAPTGSLYCTSSSSLQADAGSVTVTPNTTYFIWVTDGFTGNFRPDVNLCLW